MHAAGTSLGPSAVLLADDVARAGRLLLARAMPDDEQEEAPVPSVPSSAFQLVMLLLFVLPGSVYQFVRTRLRGPHRDDFSALNRSLRALGASTLFVIVYALLIGPRVLSLIRRTQSSDSAQALSAVRPLAWYALVLLFAVPAAAAVVAQLSGKIPRAGLLQRVRSSYDPTPSAWDFTFDGLGPHYIRVLTGEGSYIGGWYGPDSFVTSYPEPHEIFLEVAHHMGPDGTFGAEVEHSKGVYIRCDDIRLVEIVAAPVDSPDPDPAP